MTILIVTDNPVLNIGLRTIIVGGFPDITIFEAETLQKTLSLTFTIREHDDPGRRCYRRKGYRKYCFPISPPAPKTGGSAGRRDLSPTCS
jgi:hypothetical protein